MPFVELTSERREIGEALDDAMRRVIERGQYILGRELEAFETEFASYCGVKHCVGVGSGSEALHLALLACGVGPGDEVVTVSHSFFATGLAIAQVGAVPVFVDVDPRTHLLDPSKLGDALTSRTRAVLPVHLYGNCADLDPILELARDRSLFVIEDAAQAHGATYRGRKAGSLGHVGCFSFYPTKNLGAYGDGGAVVTDDPEIADRLGLLRNYGQRTKYFHDRVGYNSRLDELQAAVLRVKLGVLDRWNARRSEIAARYDAGLRSGLLAGRPRVVPGSESAHHLYVIEVDGRDDFAAELALRGVQTRIHYPVPIHRQHALDAIAHRTGDMDVTERIAGRVLSLPLYPFLAPERVGEVVEAVNACGRP